MMKFQQNAQNTFSVRPNSSSFPSPFYSVLVYKVVIWQQKSPYLSLLITVQNLTWSMQHNQQRCQKTDTVKLKDSCPVHLVKNVP